MINDLISRSALMQSLRNNVLVDLTSNLEQAIEEQPIAYDVDKVVERLESVSIPEDKILYASPDEFGQFVKLKDAVEIVKSGGIE